MDLSQLPEGLDNLRLVTRNSGMDDPESLEDYRTHGGFVALEKARSMGPEKVVEMLKAAKLRGRGGGGFPTGE